MVIVEEEDMFGFKNIHFCFDHEGNIFPENKKITVTEVKCKCFRLLSTTLASHPALQIRAVYFDQGIEQHPWFEVDFPPTVMFTIIFPNVHFLSHLAEITGLEDGNMIYAGMIKPPYYKERAIPGVEYFNFEKLTEQTDFRTLKGFKFQKIVVW
jgi:hypothetical protein